MFQFLALKVYRKRMFLMCQHWPLSLYIFVLFSQYFTKKTVVFSGTHTQIVGVEGDDADH